jgi:hypothetical protein
MNEQTNYRNATCLTNGKQQKLVFLLSFVHIGTYRSVHPTLVFVLIIRYTETYARLPPKITKGCPIHKYWFVILSKTNTAKLANNKQP